jgi:hypothetical protein
MKQDHLFILAGAAILIMMSRPRPAVARPGGLNSGQVNTIVSGINRWLSGTPTTQRPPASQPYGGVVNPSRPVLNNAQTAAMRDEDPALNGSVGDWVANDGTAANPPSNLSPADQADAFYNGS